MENHVADQIRFYRRQEGLTQEQLAEAMGVSVAAVSKWEQGVSLFEKEIPLPYPHPYASQEMWCSTFGAAYPPRARKGAKKRFNPLRSKKPHGAQSSSAAHSAAASS